MNCPECGHVVEIPENMDEITCNNCNSLFYPDIELIEGPEEIINPVTLDSSYLTAEDIDGIQKFIIREREKEKLIKKEVEPF
jgi:hypothetical protein